MVKISALTKKSQIALGKAMSNDDLLLLCQMSGEVQRDARTVESYRDAEKKMINKYHFVVK